MSHQTIDRERIFQIIRFPGVLFAGLLIFFFALLRLYHWSPVDTIFPGAIGLALILLGVALYFSTMRPWIGMVGFTIAIIASLLYYFIEGYISEIVAFIYSLGVAMILLEIIIRSTTVVRPPGPPDIERCERVFEETLQKLRQLMTGQRMVLDEKIQQKQEDVIAGLVFLIKLKDSLAQIRRDLPDNPIVNASYAGLDEFLDIRGVSEYQVGVGDEYDYLNHVMVSRVGVPSPTSRGTVIEVKRKGYRVKLEDEEEVIRKPEVAVRWDETSTLDPPQNPDTDSTAEQV
ncbi:MAG: hypothetical protein ABFC38_00440 [Methanospirillum sp.]